MQAVPEDVDAAYFADGVPTVCFLDAAARRLDDGQILDIQGRLWNRATPQLLVAVLPGRLQVRTCLLPDGRRPSPEDTVVYDQPLSAGGVAQEGFAYYGLRRGMAARHLQKFPGRSVDEALLRHLQDLRQQLKQANLAEDVTNALLGRSVFIRFLEERQPDWTKQWADGATYTELLDAGDPAAVYRYFEQIALHLNGDLFPIRGVERASATSTHLAMVSRFLRAEAPSGQQSLWPYNFRMIPVELVGAIYEEFLRSKQKTLGAYYTRPDLVRVVLDHVDASIMDRHAPRVLDPACGSGAFLVEAFRRLFRPIQSQSSSAASSFEAAKGVLQNSIFGVDIDEGAIDVAAFSLCLVLLDSVAGQLEFEGMRLPALRSRSLIHSDFFHEDLPFSRESMDVVVGNPPWQSRFSPAATQYHESRASVVGDRQVAQLFVYRSSELLRSGGRLAMVGPAKGWVHNRSGPNMGFRRWLFGTMNADTVIDLASFRARLFAGATAPAAIISLQKPGTGELDPSKPGHMVSVATPHPTRVGRAFGTATAARRNVRLVPALRITEDPTLINVSLWGSERDQRLIQRLRQSWPSLRQVARERHWTIGEGLKVGVKGRLLHDASAFRSLRIVSPGEVGFLTVSDGVRRYLERDAVLFLPKEAQSLFEQPHIVIPGAPVGGRRVRAGFTSEPLLFTHACAGIAAADDDALLLVTAILNSTLASYYLFLTSSVWGKEREDVDSGEMKSLPLALSQRAVERLRRDWPTLLGLSPTARQQQVDEFVHDLYGLSTSERTLVYSRMADRMEEFHARSTLAGPQFSAVTEDALRGYERVLLRVLNANLDDGPAAACWSRLRGYIVFSCATGDPSWSHGETTHLDFAGHALEWLKEDEGKIAHLLSEPECLVVEGSEAHILRSDDLRCWTEGQALDDADEIIAELLRREEVETTVDAKRS
ncbi:MAG: HsdM family class I SAM-dependent methyltransferase [Candidatus Dormibacteria bacterium]